MKFPRLPLLSPSVRYFPPFSNSSLPPSPNVRYHPLFPQPYPQLLFPHTSLFSLPNTCVPPIQHLPHTLPFPLPDTCINTYPALSACTVFLTTRYLWTIYPAPPTSLFSLPNTCVNTHPALSARTVFLTARYLPHKVPGGHWRQMAGWTYGKKREEWVIEFASQKQILRIAEQTKHQFCLRFYPVHPFFPLFSISPSPSADWPPGTLCGRYRPP